MGHYKNNQRKKELKLSTNNKKRKLIGAAIGVMVATLAMIPEYQEQMEKAKIERNSNREAIRSFKNIRKDNRGKYLENEIEKLYAKYPDLDNIIFESREEAGEKEFIEDIYRLYKAFMVDKSEKEIENIENVQVKTVDQIIFHSDLIKEGNKQIIDTHKEQYKMITDSYIEAENTNGTKLAKEIYELLALELGLEPELEESILSPQEIEKEIQDKGFYYDQRSNTVYTKEGKENIELDKSQNLEKLEEQDDKEIELN